MRLLTPTNVFFLALGYAIQVVVEGETRRLGKRLWWARAKLMSSSILRPFRAIIHGPHSWPRSTFSTTSQLSEVYIGRAPCRWRSLTLTHVCFAFNFNLGGYP